jgi:alpha-beta hydrolase superfamily lysophospholipase
MDAAVKTIRDILLLAMTAILVAISPGAEAAGDWQSLIDKAEPLYAARDYKAALPLYEQAAQNAVTNADRIHCLRYLADCLCRLNHPDDALKQYETVATLIAPDDVQKKIENINHEALCFGMKGDYAKAESLSRAAEKLCDATKPDDQWLLARTLAQRGYFDYTQAKYQSAIKYFEQADTFAEQSKKNDVNAQYFRAKMAFAQAGSYYHLRRFDEAYNQFKRMYEHNVQLFGKTDLQTGWAMLALSDVLERLNQKQQADDWYRKSVYVFRKYNKDRITAQFGATDDTTKERINTYIFGKSKIPADLEEKEEPLCADSKTLLNTHDPRSLYARPLPDAPGRVWLNPAVPQRAIVIAIHGLSLEHSSYDALAKQLADAGITTVAFDVRGFGTYQQALGAEHLDFDGCLHDLHAVVSAIKADNPGRPLFVLGESMGGAIALQFAAHNPNLVDGLITSVPAGKRFKQATTSVKVALKYLGNKHKPFDIGTDVINLATKDPNLKTTWGDDPKTRSTLSPQELLTFQLMCNRNLENAKQLHETPVIVFQGVQDGLIKPEATYELFRAMSPKDKSFVMLGNTEHLIFEEGCFTPTVLKGLIAWMEAHFNKSEGLTAERADGTKYGVNLHHQIGNSAATGK